MEQVTLKMVQEAQERLKGVAQKTGLSYSNSVSKLSDCKVYLKMENLQRTGSFKLRGAYNKVASLTPEEREKGVIAASAGNHAQGVALAASVYGCQSTICMPKHAPLMKVAATKGYGANVVLHGDFFDEAAAKAEELTKEHGYTFVHPFNDPEVIAGQGTIALEIIEQMPDVDAIVAPIGGGGLISGLAVAAKSVNPKIKVIGVQTANMPSMKNSIDHGKILTCNGKATLADGIAVKTPGDLTYDICSRYLDDIVIVDETEIAGAILWLLERCKAVSEGAGAVPVAALMNGKISGLHGKKVAALISGGNIDVNNMTRIINSGLLRSWRKVFFSTIIPDQPGELVKLLSLIAETNANVLSVTHERSQHGVGIGYTAVSFELETANEKHVEHLMELLRDQHYQVTIK
ncbi:threonine ammonia-lyase [Megasphaera hominis]|jgi:threonine dehydratase|uniref:L-threonine dehydratase catabolic TdcB n=1 Tax=Megasphaera hominis TaxID=159836 RepID=A0ABR6VJT9_9FIRM|nr:threonine ammonia-lyase [Megasphaera hominis]MBC3537484.1 threonine ammonia-lyase [Megasphaera hominis]